MSYRQTYNKSVRAGHGTLIGNWFEEEVLRNVTGHTHLNSSRAQDTFCRVMGERPCPPEQTFVTSAGRRTHEGPPFQGRRLRSITEGPQRVKPAARRAPSGSASSFAPPHQLQLQTQPQQQSQPPCASSTLRFGGGWPLPAPHEEPRLAAHAEGEGMAALAARRSGCQNTVASAAYRFRVEEASVKADEAARLYFKRQLEERPAETSELVSRWTALAAAGSSSVSRTPHTGRMLFGKDSFFSLPTHLAAKGLSKDQEALEILDQSLRRMSHITPAPTGDLPALQAFKTKLRDCIVRTRGPTAFLLLRAGLKELCDERGLVAVSEVEDLLRGQFGVCHSEIPQDHLRSALNILTSMEKELARASDLVDFIWAPLPAARGSILSRLGEAATHATEVQLAGSAAPTLRLTKPKPRVALASIPEFLHAFLKPQGGAAEGSSCAAEETETVPLWLLLEALIDLSQGVPEDGSFLSTVSEIAAAEGLSL